jgi:uncharacterized membrane protein
VKNIQKNRFWEIDSLRGIAIIMMIIYHIIFDLYFLEIYDFDIHTLGFRVFLYPIGTLFLFLVGVCLTISYNRSKKNFSEKVLFKKFLFRGLKVFGLGLIITFFTWFFIGEGFIVFGVLHCIGVSIILAYPFLRFKFSYFVVVFCLFVVIVGGVLLRSFTFDFSWLVWLGFIPSGFYTLDYFPLLPWFGVVLVGVLFGNVLYEDGVRSFHVVDLSENFLVRFLCFLGRNSLLIYFVHQPVVLVFLFLIY